MTSGSANSWPSRQPRRRVVAAGSCQKSDRCRVVLARAQCARACRVARHLLRPARRTAANGMGPPRRQNVPPNFPALAQTQHRSYKGTDELYFVRDKHANKSQMCACSLARTGKGRALDWVGSASRSIFPANRLVRSSATRGFPDEDEFERTDVNEPSFGRLTAINNNIPRHIYDTYAAL